MECNTSLDSSSERFIPLRGASFGSFQVAHKFPKTKVSCREYCRKFTKRESGCNFMQFYYKKNNYKELLAKTLFQSPRRVLYFSPEQKSKSDYIEGNEIEWPVRARKKPLITVPQYLWDVSGINATGQVSRQKFDWGPNGFLAGVSENEVYLQNPDLNTRKTLRVDKKEFGGCLKWTNRQNHIAVSLNKGGFDIWDIQYGKVVLNHKHQKRITFIAYSHSFMITCHISGTIQIYDHNLHLLKSIKNAHKARILSARISCNERYLATNSTNSVIKIWSLPDCIKMIEIICKPHYVLSIDWHPWKESLLALGGTSKDSLSTIWDINKSTHSIQPNQSDEAIVDCLSFNPISAELVVGFWLDQQSADHHSVIVQSNSSTVIDDMNLHLGRVLYLLWDHEGKRLATIGVDENLAVWNFFGKEEEKCYSPIRKDFSIFRQGIIR